VTNDPNPRVREPGPEAGIDGIQAESEPIRTGLDETVEAVSANPDVAGRAKHKVADTKEQLAEKATQTKNRIVEKSHVAQSVARDSVTDHLDWVKAGVLIAAGAVAVIGVVVWRRRR